MKTVAVRPASTGRKNKSTNRRTQPKLPSFADAVKRLSGIMEGAPDLSMREGFGPKLPR
jgi:hypothetical protein